MFDYVGSSVVNIPWGLLFKQSSDDERFFFNNFLFVFVGFKTSDVKIDFNKELFHIFVFVYLCVYCYCFAGLYTQSLGLLESRVSSKVFF